MSMLIHIGKTSLKVKHPSLTSESKLYTIFLIKMSNFGAEAERSYRIWRCEADNVLKDVLNFTRYSFSKTDILRA